MIKLTAKEKAYNKIKNDIKKGILRANDKVAEEKYAALTGVSRTPLREAIRSLEKEGLVYSRPSVGSFVTEITDSDILEIFEIKAVIEPIVYKKAFEYMNENSIKNLTKLVENAQQQITSGNFEELSKFSVKFHHEICLASRLTHAVNVLDRLQGVQDVIRYRTIGIDGAKAKDTVDEYEAILNALTSHDYDLYEKKVLKHIDSAKRRYLSQI